MFGSTMNEQLLVRCPGVVKIFKTNSTQIPRDHSGSIAVVKIGSNFYLQQDGKAIPRSRQKVTSVVLARSVGV